MNKKVVLFGAGNYGRRALKIFGKDNIAFFLDTDPKLLEKKIDGIPIKSFMEEKDTLNSYDIVLSVSDKYYEELEGIMKKYCRYRYWSIDQYLNRDNHNLEIWDKFKNIYN